MKKNFAMRVAACLLVVTMLSLCMVSYTYAKFVTSDAAEDTARVAKWGVIIAATDDGDSQNVLDTLEDNTEAEISVVKEMKLLAPGTKGGLVNVDVTGQPEVAVNVDVDFTLTLADWLIDADNGGSNNDEYMPLVFTAVIGGVSKTYKLGTTAGTGVYTTIAALTTALKNDIEAANANYVADTDLGTIFDLELSWEWAFSVDTATDVKDTALGDLTTAPTLTVEYSITITQLN